MTYDSVFSGIELVDFSRKEGKRSNSVRPRNKPQDIVRVLDTLSGSFVSEVKQGIEMVIRGQLVPLLPRIRGKDKTVVAEVDNIKWANFLYIPVYNGLWSLWNRGFSQGVLAGLKELGKVSNFNNYEEEFYAEFASKNSEENQRKLFDLSKQLNDLDRPKYREAQIRRAIRRNNKSGRRFTTKEVVERTEAKLEELKIETNRKRDELINTPSLVDKSPKSSKKGKTRTINVMGKEIEVVDTEEEIKEKKKRTQKEVASDISRGESDRAKALKDYREKGGFDKERQGVRSQEQDLRNVARKEIKRTSQAMSMLIPSPNALLEETKFGKSYLKHRTGYIAKNLIYPGEKPEEIAVNIPTKAVANYISRKSVDREKLLFDDIQSRLFPDSSRSMRGDIVNKIRLREDEKLQRTYGNSVSLEKIGKGKEINQEVRDLQWQTRGDRNEKVALEDRLDELFRLRSKVNKGTATRAEQVRFRSLDAEKNKIRARVEALTEDILNRGKKIKETVQANRKGTAINALKRTTKFIEIEEDEAKILGTRDRKISVADLDKAEKDRSKGGTEAEKQNRLNTLFKIASTEVVHAYNLGRLTSFQANGVTEVEWSADAEHYANALGNKSKKGKAKITPYACKVCEERHGEKILISKVLGSKEWVIAAHPYCKCTWLPVTDSTKKGGATTGKEKSSGSNKSEEVSSKRFVNSLAKWATGAGVAIISTTAMYAAFKSGIGNTRSVVERVVKNNEEAREIAKNVIQDQVQDATREVTEKIDEAVKKVAPTKVTPTPDVPVNIPLPKLVDDVELTALEQKQVTELQSRVSSLHREIVFNPQESKDTVEEVVNKLSTSIRDETYEEIVAISNLTNKYADSIAISLANSPTDLESVEKYTARVKQLYRQIDKLRNGGQTLSEQLSNLSDAYFDTYKRLRDKVKQDNPTFSDAVIDKALENSPALKRIEQEAQELSRHVDKLQQQEALRSDLENIYYRAIRDRNFRTAYLNNKEVQDNSIALYNSLTGKGSRIVGRISSTRKSLKEIENRLIELGDNDLSPAELDKYMQTVQRSRGFISRSRSTISKSGVDTDLLKEIASNSDISQVTIQQKKRTLYRAATTELSGFNSGLVKLNKRVTTVQRKILEKANSSTNPTTKKLANAYSQYNSPAATPKQRRVARQTIAESAIRREFYQPGSKELVSFGLEYRKLIGLGRKYVSLGRFCGGK